MYTRAPLHFQAATPIADRRSHRRVVPAGKNDNLNVQSRHILDVEHKAHPPIIRQARHQGRQLLDGLALTSISEKGIVRENRVKLERNLS